MVSAKHLPLFNTSPFDFKWERLTWTAQCRVCEAPGVGRGPICRGSEGCRSGALLPSPHVPWTLPQSLRGSWRRPALTPKPWLGLPACLSWAYRRPWCWGYGAPQAQSSVMSSYTGPLRGPEQAGHSGDVTSPGQSFCGFWRGGIRISKRTLLGKWWRLGGPLPGEPYLTTSRAKSLKPQRPRASAGALGRSLHRAPQLPGLWCFPLLCL